MLEILVIPAWWPRKIVSSESLNCLKIVPWYILLCIKRPKCVKIQCLKTCIYYYYFQLYLVCNEYKISLIVPAWLSKNNMFRCFRDLENIYHTQYLPLDLIYYHATCNKPVLPGKSL